MKKKEIKLNIIKSVKAEDSTAEFILEEYGKKYFVYVLSPNSQNRINEREFSKFDPAWNYFYDNEDDFKRDYKNCV